MTSKSNNYPIKQILSNVKNIQNGKNNKKRQIKDMQEDKLSIPTKGTLSSNANYSITQSSKLLLPINCMLNASNLKLCQKVLLPEEKNFFVSEENFMKIKRNLEEKEEKIRKLEEEIKIIKSVEFGDKVKYELMQLDIYINSLEKQKFT